MVALPVAVSYSGQLLTGLAVSTSLISQVAQCALTRDGAFAGVIT